MLTLRIVAAICFGLSALGLGGCQTTTAGGAVGAERKQLMLVSSQELDQMAAQSYTKLKSDAPPRVRSIPDRAMLQRVRAIAARIEPQTRVFRPDAPGVEVGSQRNQQQRAQCLLHAGRQDHVLFRPDPAAQSER